MGPTRRATTNYLRCRGLPSRFLVRTVSDVWESRTGAVVQEVTDGFCRVVLRMPVLVRSADLAGAVVVPHRATRDQVAHPASTREDLDGRQDVASP